jgi:hypothetical protein
MAMAMTLDINQTRLMVRTGTKNLKVKIGWEIGSCRARNLITYRVGVGIEYGTDWNLIILCDIPVDILPLCSRVPKLGSRGLYLTIS